MALAPVPSLFVFKKLSPSQLTVIGFELYNLGGFVHCSTDCTTAVDLQ
jgi:hypothetical protein